MGGRRQLSSGVSGGEGPLERSMVARIDAVGAKGEGRGRGPAGEDIRVPGVLPGERVRVEVVHTRKDGVRFGRPLRVESPASARVSAVCPHFLRCGGCDFLHADLPWQRAWKRARVASALGLSSRDVAATVPSPDDLGYRHLVKLVKGPKGRLGSYAPRSHDVVPMHGCSVHAPVGEAIADAVRAVIAADGQVDFRYLLVRVSSVEQRAVVTIVVRTPQRPSVQPVVDALVDRADVAQVRLHVNDTDGNVLLTDRPDDVVFDDRRPVVERLGAVEQILTAGAFAQVNPRAATLLYACVAETLQARGTPVLDLYAGSGGISLTLLARGAAKVMAVESVAGAVEAARASASAAGWAPRFEGVVSTVEAAMPDLPPWDHVVVNPPRKGLTAPVRAALAARRWRRLVYVSCDPDTLARDVATIRGRVTSVVPVDLFPHTHHVETVLTLER